MFTVSDFMANKPADGGVVHIGWAVGTKNEKNEHFWLLKMLIENIHRSIWKKWS